VRNFLPDAAPWSWISPLPESWANKFLPIIIIQSVVFCCTSTKWPRSQ
jgi:hypothetical protein